MRAGCLAQHCYNGSLHFLLKRGLEKITLVLANNELFEADKLKNILLDIPDETVDGCFDSTIRGHRIRMKKLTFKIPN